MTSRSWVSINICWMNGLGLNSLAVWFSGPALGLGHLPACQAHLAPSVMGTTPPRLQGQLHVGGTPFPWTLGGPWAGQAVSGARAGRGGKDHGGQSPCAPDLSLSASFRLPCLLLAAEAPRLCLHPTISSPLGFPTPGSPHHTGCPSWILPCGRRACGGGRVTSLATQTQG